MNQRFKISIDKPCQEKFNSFEPTAAGGFCNSCHKEVVDFSRMSDKEIIEYFKKAGSTCGRFKQSQLREYSHALHPGNTKMPVSIGAGFGLSLLSILPFTGSQAQDKVQPPIHIQQHETVNQEQAGVKTNPGDSLLTGVVKDGNETVPFANIILKDSLVGVSTDIDGKFTFPVPLKKGDVLVISFTGYLPTEYKITNEKTIVVNLREDPDPSDMVMMGEVNIEKPYASKKSFWNRLKTLF